VIAGLVQGPGAILLALLLSTSARAGEPTYLRAGEPAPYDGELVPSSLLHHLLKADAGRRQAEGQTRVVRAERDRLAGSLTAERALREADRVEAEERERAQADALARCEGLARDVVKPSESLWPYVWGGLGGLAVGVVVGVWVSR
jgi:hypothetical protein